MTLNIVEILLGFGLTCCGLRLFLELMRGRENTKRTIRPQSPLAQKQALRSVLYDCTIEKHMEVCADIRRQRHH